MRTAEEIRRHLQDLEAANVRPCDCGRVSAHHSRQCQEGGRMMRANIEILQWVLGESPRYEEIVARIRTDLGGTTS